MHDLALQNGRIHDGLGSDETIGDIAVRDGRIVAVGTDLGPARRSIDIDGRVVCPGFIDPHTHSDMVPFLDEPQPYKLMQGITTEIAGNCGFSFAPLCEQAAASLAPSVQGMTCGMPIEAASFEEFLARTEHAQPTNNIGLLVGHNTLRLHVNGEVEVLCPGALDEMCRLAGRAFAVGAMGFSTGLIYRPGTHADIDEVVELAKVARRWGRPYTTHLRDEGRFVLDALDEAIEIARRAQVPVQISHCKAAGRASHGRSSAILTRMREARASGIDIRGDQYPYEAGSTVLSAMFPPVFFADGTEAFVRSLDDRDFVERVRAVADDQDSDAFVGLWRDVEPADILIMTHREAELSGRSLDELQHSHGDGDPWRALCRVYAADAGAMMATRILDHGDVMQIMADPLIAIGSDSEMPVGLHHPRTWGCHPRFLGEFVRDAAVVPLPEAIRKMTSAAAAPFDVGARGWIAPGTVADLCIFDASTVGHAGDFLEPDAPTTGIEYVVLDGHVVVDDGEFTGAERGRLLRAGSAA